MSSQPNSAGQQLYDEIASSVSSLSFVDRLSLIAAIQSRKGYAELPEAARRELERIAVRRFT